MNCMCGGYLQSEYYYDEADPWNENVIIRHHRGFCTDCGRELKWDQDLATSFVFNIRSIFAADNMEDYIK